LGASATSTLLVLTLGLGCMYHGSARRQDLTEPALLMIEAMPADSICTGACVAVAVDPRIRAEPTYERRLEPEIAGTLVFPAGRPRSVRGVNVIVRPFSLEQGALGTLGPDTAGYRVVAHFGPPIDTLLLRVQFFVSRMQHGQSEGVFVWTDGHWRLVERRTGWF